MPPFLSQDDKLAACIRSLTLPVRGPISQQWLDNISNADQYNLLRNIITVMLDIGDERYRGLAADVALYNFIRMADIVNDSAKHVSIVRVVVREISAKYHEFIGTPGSDEHASPSGASKPAPDTPAG